MNAVTHPAAANPANKMRWLLRREFWENKGGLFWAPVFTSIIWLGIVLVVFLAFEMSVNRANIEIANLKLDTLLQTMTPQIEQHVRLGVEAALYIVAGLFGVVQFFVLFFYCLGALYDDRRDRSVLFWKSLPISDRATVLSKVLTAMVVGPLISVAAAAVTGTLFLLLITVFGAFHGVNLVSLLWGKGAPLTVAAHLVAFLPVQMLWALPTVGWLLLCSAWARSKPFLWAVALPVGAGVVVSMGDLMRSLSMPDAWFWQHIVARLLLSFFPASWVDASALIRDDVQSPDQLLKFVDLGNMYSVFGSADLWVGAVAGIAMLVGAVYFRRKRDES
jgi:ABC-2 type transport system permease protein